MVSNSLSMKDKATKVIYFQRSVGSPAELIDTDSGCAWSGLISVTTYGLMLRSNWTFDEKRFAFLVQVLPTALRQVVRHIRFSSFLAHDSSHPLDAQETRNILDNTSLVRSLATKPFSTHVRIRRTVELLLGKEFLTAWSSTARAASIENLPQFQSLIRQLETECSCTTEEIMEDLAAVVADVLCLSLFDNLDMLLVAHGDDKAEEQPFTSAVKSILEQHTPLMPCHLNDILQYALALVGHPVLEEDVGRWMMSSYRGQAVYLKLFEKAQVMQPGFLTLSWAPGVLKVNGDTYHEAHSNVDPDFSFETDDPARGDGPPKLVWRTAPSSDGTYLDVEVQFVFDEGNFLTVAPRKILRTLSSSLILPPCSHRSKDTIQPIANNFQYTDPISPFAENIQNKGDWNGIISVVVTQGTDSLRMCALALEQPGVEEVGGFPYVLCGAGCLHCALDVCRKAKYPGVMC
jgi:hypothetical protein